MAIKGIQHSLVAFEQFLQSMDGDVCPVGGEMTFIESEVECSVYTGEEEDSDDNVKKFRFFGFWRVSWSGSSWMGLFFRPYGLLGKAVY